MNAVARALPLNTLRSLTIDVPGHPAPKGSKKCVGSRGRAKHVLVEMSPLLPAWAEAVEAAAGARVRLDKWVKLDRAVSVSVWAWFRRPKSVTRPYPSTRSVGDADKIARGVLDALVAAGVLSDDALVVDLDVHERYATGSASGARLVVTELEAGK